MKIENIKIKILKSPKSSKNAIFYFQLKIYEFDVHKVNNSLTLLGTALGHLDPSQL